MPIYLKLGDIKGDVQDARYKDWIQIESVQVEKSPPGAVGVGRGTGGSGKTGTQASVHGPVTLTMLTGAASVKLVQLAGKGKTIPEAVIVLDHGDAGTLTITMKDVLVSSYQFGGAGGGGLPMDTFTLEPLEITFETGPAQKEEPTPGPAYQLKKNQSPKWRR